MQRSLIASLCLAVPVFAAANPFTPGDIIISAEQNHVHTVYEYTRSGGLVQSISVPFAPGEDTSTGLARDVAVDPSGNLQVFNGTFSASISSYDVNASTWSHHTMANFGILNNGTYGKLATYGHYVFATTGILTYNGLARLDTSTGSVTRVLQEQAGDAPFDVTLGKDGILYVLDGNLGGAATYIRAFDPQTLTLLRTIALPSSLINTHPPCNFAVDGSGFIYLNQINGNIFKLSQDGQQVLLSGAYQETATYCDDLDLSDDGTFMVTEGDGRVVFLNSNLVQTSTFATTGYYVSRSFGGFVPGTVPEPESAAVFAVAVLVLWRRRK